MKFIIVFAALFAVALAAPNYETDVVQQESDVAPESFHHILKLGDGSFAEAEGKLKDIGEEKVLSVEGSYKFVADDGQTYEVTYVADENGFQPKGAHLPVAPEA